MRARSRFKLAPLPNIQTIGTKADDGVPLPSTFPSNCTQELPAPPQATLFDDGRSVR